MRTDLGQWCYCVVMWCYLCVGPGQQQGEVDAVFSGQNGHCLLSVLNIHSIYLTVIRYIEMDYFILISKSHHTQMNKVQMDHSVFFTSWKWITSHYTFHFPKNTCNLRICEQKSKQFLDVTPAENKMTKKHKKCVNYSWGRDEHMKWQVSSPALQGDTKSVQNLCGDGCHRNQCWHHSSAAQ